MDIFISHIHEEKSLASKLKDWIESTFAGQFKVFVSSDLKDIPAGSRWLDKIDEALNSAKVLLMLCSAESIKRPWINFEAGCGWIKEIPIIPLCHSGLSKSNLPSPISNFQALEINDELFPKQLLDSLKKHLKVKKLPRISFKDMKSDIDSAISSLTYSDGKDVISLRNGTKVKTGKLNEIQKKILLILSGVEERMNGLNAFELAYHHNIVMPEDKIKHYLDLLLEQEYIYSQLFRSAPTKYKLAKKGNAYLVKNNLI